MPEIFQCFGMCLMILSNVVLHISGNCTPSDTASQQRRQQLNCTPGGTVTAKKTAVELHTWWHCHSKEDCSRTAHLVALHYGKVVSSTSSHMSSDVQTQDVEVRSIVTYLTVICFINFINVHKQIYQKPCIFYTCSDASPTCSGLSAFTRRILTNTLRIAKVLLPCYNISADIVTCICSAVDLTGVVPVECTRLIVFVVARIHQTRLLTTLSGLKLEAEVTNLHSSLTCCKKSRPASLECSLTGHIGRTMVVLLEGVVPNQQ